MDLQAASISQVNNALLRFRLDIADQPPVIGAAPQAVYYNWPVGVMSESNMAVFNLQAIRSDVYSVATAGKAIDEPVFRLQTCVPNPDTGGNTCSVTAQLVGEFGDGYLAIDVPLGTLGAAPVRPSRPERSPSTPTSAPARCGSTGPATEPTPCRPCSTTRWGGRDPGRRRGRHGT